MSYSLANLTWKCVTIEIAALPIRTGDFWGNQRVVSQVGYPPLVVLLCRGTCRSKAFAGAGCIGESQGQMWISHDQDLRSDQIINGVRNLLVLVETINGTSWLLSCDF